MLWAQYPFAVFPVLNRTRDASVCPSLAIVVACIAIQILSGALDIFEKPFISGNKEY
jgi:hypothetical protein